MTVGTPDFVTKKHRKLTESELKGIVDRLCKEQEKERKVFAAQLNELVDNEYARDELEKRGLSYCLLTCYELAREMLPADKDYEKITSVKKKYFP